MPIGFCKRLSEVKLSDLPHFDEKFDGRNLG
jgi:hypothetical protein